MKRILLSAVALMCLIGFNAVSFADELGKMKDEMKGEMKSDMKATGDAMKEEVTGRKDEIKGAMGALKGKKDEMKGAMGELKGKKDVMKNEMKMKKDDIKGTMKDEMKSQKDAMKGEIKGMAGY